MALLEEPLYEEIAELPEAAVGVVDARLEKPGLLFDYADFGEATIEPTCLSRPELFSQELFNTFGFYVIKNYYPTVGTLDTNG